MLLPVDFCSELRFITAFKTHLLINKGHNFRSSSSSNIIRVNSSSVPQLATALVHELTSLLSYRLTNFSQISLRFPP